MFVILVLLLWFDEALAYTINSTCSPSNHLPYKAGCSPETSQLCSVGPVRQSSLCTHRVIVANQIYLLGKSLLNIYQRPSVHRRRLLVSGPRRKERVGGSDWLTECGEGERVIMEMLWEYNIHSRRFSVPSLFQLSFLIIVVFVHLISNITLKFYYLKEYRICELPPKRFV